MTANADRRRQIQAANDRGNAAFHAGRLGEATRCYQEAVGLLRPEQDDLAAAIWENLGLALYNRELHRPAIRAFLRSLDGRPTSREQSLRLLITSAALDGRAALALSQLHAYQAAFGAHPHGWTLTGLTELGCDLRQRRSHRVPG